MSVSGCMIDTNIFNHLLDGKVDISALKSLGLKLYVTHIQYDELNKTPNAKRRSELLKLTSSLTDDSIDTESMVIGVSRLDSSRISSDVIMTESAVYDVSKWGLAKFTKENSLYETIRAELDKKNSKPNNIQDALIAETSILNNLVLITNDKNLKLVVERIGGLVQSLKN